MNLNSDDKYKNKLLYRFCKNTFQRIHLLELDLMRLVTGYTPNEKVCLMCKQKSLYKNFVYFRLCGKHIPKELKRKLKLGKGGTSIKTVSRTIYKTHTQGEFGYPFQNYINNVGSEQLTELKQQGSSVIVPYVNKQVGMYMQLYSILFVHLLTEDIENLDINNIFNQEIDISGLDINTVFDFERPVMSYNLLFKYQEDKLATGLGKGIDIECIDNFCVHDNLKYQCINNQCYEYIRIYKKNNHTKVYNKVLIKGDGKSYISIGKDNPPIDVTEYQNLTPLYEIPFHLKFDLHTVKLSKKCKNVLDLWNPKIDDNTFRNRVTAFLGWNSFLINSIVDTTQDTKVNVDEYNVFIDDEYRVLIIGECHSSSGKRCFLNEYYHGDQLDNASEERRDLYFKIFDEIFKY